MVPKKIRQAANQHQCVPVSKGSCQKRRIQMRVIDGFCVPACSVMPCNYRMQDLPAPNPKLKDLKRPQKMWPPNRAAHEKARAVSLLVSKLHGCFPARNQIHLQVLMWLKSWIQLPASLGLSFEGTGSKVLSFPNKQICWQLLSCKSYL